MHDAVFLGDFVGDGLSVEVLDGFHALEVGLLLVETVSLLFGELLGKDVVLLFQKGVVFSQVVDLVQQGEVLLVVDVHWLLCSGLFMGFLFLSVCLFVCLFISLTNNFFLF